MSLLEFMPLHKYCNNNNNNNNNTASCANLAGASQHLLVTIAKNCTARFLYISVINKASDFKFSMPLGFAKAHHQVPLKENMGVALV